MVKFRAFTLVELIVVILIVAVIAALLFPVLASGKRSAKAATCSSNLHQIALAAIQYAGDNDDHYPFSIMGNNEWLARIGLAKRFPNYMNKTMIVCPELAAIPERQTPDFSGYAYNQCTSDKGPANPSRIAMVGEFAFFHPVGRPDYPVTADWMDMPDSYWADRSPWVSDVLGSKYAAYGEWGAKRHMGQGNYVFFDGHGKRLAPGAFRIPASGNPCGRAANWLGPESGPSFDPVAAQ